MKTKKEKSIKKFQLDKIVISKFDTKKVKGGLGPYTRKLTIVSCGYTVCGC